MLKNLEMSGNFSLFVCEFEGSNLGLLKWKLFSFVWKESFMFVEKIGIRANFF